MPREYTHGRRIDWVSVVAFGALCQDFAFESTMHCITSEINYLIII